MKKIICSTLSIVLVVLFLITPNIVVNAKTYKQDVTYKFKGKIEKVSREQFNGQWVTSYCIKLKKAIKVKSVWGQKVKVKRMDIYTHSKKKIKKIKKKIHKRVTIKGKIFEPGSSYYVNQFVLELKKIR